MLEKKLKRSKVLRVNSTHAAPKSYTIQGKKVFKFCLVKQRGSTETVCPTLTGRVRTAAVF